MKLARFALVPLLMLITSAWAQVTEPPGSENWDTMRQRAVELHEKAKAMRAEAATRHGEATQTCPDRFFSAICMEEAAKKRTETEREAKRVEREARELDRQLKAHERELKDAKREEDAPKREADKLRQAEKNRKAQEEAQRRVERKAAEDERRKSGRK